MTIQTIRRAMSHARAGPDRGALLSGTPRTVKPQPPASIAFEPLSRQERAMPPGSDKPPDTPTREQRLAAKLRENLHRRKAQARVLGDTDKPALPKPLPKS